MGIDVFIGPHLLHLVFRTPCKIFCSIKMNLKVYIYIFFQLLLLTTFYHSWLWCKDDLIVKYLLGYICQKKVPIPVKYHSKRHTVTQSIKFLSLRENVIAMQFSRTMKVRETRITFQQTKLMPTKLFLLQCCQLWLPT